MEERRMNITPAQVKELVAEVTVKVLAAMMQPAETVTQTVVSVAKTGQRTISKAVKQKVRAQRVHNGGTIPTGIPCWQLIDDGIIDAEGNPIADAKAPTATKTTVTKASGKLTAGDIKRMNRAQIAQHISRKDLIALL